MKKLFRIDTIKKRELFKLEFGIPDSKQELDQMYRLRYKVYTDKNLMERNSQQKDKDFMDGKCYYFIAKFNGRVIGSTRMIFGEILPTEDEYFEIKLPDIVKETPKKKKVEIGRLAVVKVDNFPFPRHIVLLGLFYIMMTFARKKGYKLSLGAIKNYVKNKLDRINFPLNVIKDHKLIYNPKKHNDPLINFFDERTGKVWPIFVLLEDAEKYLRSLLFNKFCFIKYGDNHICLKNKFFFKLYLIKKSLFH